MYASQIIYGALLLGGVYKPFGVPVFHANTSQNTPLSRPIWLSAMDGFEIYSTSFIEVAKTQPTCSFCRLQMQWLKSGYGVALPWKLIFLTVF